MTLRTIQRHMAKQKAARRKANAERFAKQLGKVNRAREVHLDVGIHPKLIQKFAPGVLRNLLKGAIARLDEQLDTYECRGCGRTLKFKALRTWVTLNQETGLGLCVACAGGPRARARARKRKGARR
ncbi:MAG: hypothetical protein M5U26_08255 [Planctomycetota bacterium]|nr:hypothetical protein [Planctomycetota bacterium]